MEKSGFILTLPEDGVPLPLDHPMAFMAVVAFILWRVGRGEAQLPNLV